MGSIQSKVVRAIKLYLIFAVAHTGFKLLNFIRLVRYKNKIWGKVPGSKIDFTGKEVKENIHRIHDWRTAKMLKYPDAPLIQMNDQLLCTKTESVEFILKSKFESITKPGPDDMPFSLLHEFIGATGIFSVRHGSTKELELENKQWYHQRKTASLIFTKNKFKSLMHSTFSKNLKTMTEQLEAAASKKEGGEVIDIQKMFFAFTMDSIQEIFFGERVNSVAGGADVFGNAFDNAHRDMFTLIFENILAFIISKKFLPFPFGDIGGYFSVSPYVRARIMRHPVYGRFRSNIDLLGSLADDVIRKAKADPDLKNRRDMLALFLTSKAELSDEELRAVILNMTIAGRDTTACTLTWTIYMLTQFPEVEQQLCEEIDNKLGDKMPTFDDLTPDNMPYLNGVLFESLRLHPPVPMDFKSAAEDVVYYDGTIIPKGTKIGFSPYAMARNPDTYVNPLQCNPYRWIPFKQPDPYAFPVFQAGPRFCLGKDMAQFEAKMVLAALYKKFKFKLLEGEAEKITYSRMLTMSLCNSKDQTSHNLWVTPIPR